MPNQSIIHQLSLTGIGGVQQSFIPYLDYALNNSVFDHLVYGMHDLDENYYVIDNYYENIKSSPDKLLKFCYYLLSKKYIVHFYNNLGSKKVNTLLSLLPTNNILFHERGTAWNANDSQVHIYKKNSKRAKYIIANSIASKVMLSKRFNISEKKIKVVYNGFLEQQNVNIAHSKNNNKICVGYIGRLDTPKGVHIFVNAAKKLSNYNFFIAGDGEWKDYLIDLASGHGNIKFVGRVKEPLNFISQMDLIIVPSIREPLGNVIIEAGFCKKPVIASNIDGIPEIIEHKYSGILLDPKVDLTFKNQPIGSVVIPDYVVSPKTYELVKPKEINVEELCESILELSNDKNSREMYGYNLHKTVKQKFTLHKYFDGLEKIYKTF